MQTPRQIYHTIYTCLKARYQAQGLTEDKASRRANIQAVKTTWINYNNQKITTVDSMPHLSSMEFY